MRSQRGVAQREAPLELAVQPGVGPAALPPPQQAAAHEDTDTDAGDDQRGHHRDAVRQPGQRYAGHETGRAGQPGADPQLVGREPAHDHRVAVEAVRQEGHEPVARQALQGASHGCRPYSTPVALVSNQMPTTRRIAPTATVRPNWPQVARPVWISA